MMTSTNHIPFTTLNTTITPPSPTSTSFILTTPPSLKTDIYRSPVIPDTFSAPIIYKSIPLSSFSRVRVTFSHTLINTFDQAGLIFAIPQVDGSSEFSKKWIKSGLEFNEGKVWISTVAADRLADWSLAAAEEGVKEVTVEFERNAEGELWIYVVKEEGQERVPIRSVTWALTEEGSGRNECLVGVYTARPTVKDGEDPLKIHFTGFQLETLSHVQG